MIRILYVAEALSRNSGVASVITNLIRNISSENIKIDLLTYKNGDLLILDELRKYGANVYYVPELNLKSLFNFKKAVNEFFKTHRYDIVHSHFNQVDGIVFKIAKQYGVKVCISHSHNTKLSDSRIKSIRNRLLCYKISEIADVWAACSEEAGICLYGRKFSNSNKKLIIHNGVDCSRFKYNDEFRKSIRNEFQVSDSEILIGHVGGFRIQKNHDFLIDIFRELYRCDKKYKLLLVGDGELKSSIQKKVNNYGIQDRVIFAGTRTDINKIMSGMDLFILPSLYEGLPVVGIEAQASGLNCIFSDSITRDVNLTNSMFVNLNEKLDNWCRIIENTDISRHIEYQDMIKSKGFDIKKECKKISDLYIDFMKVERKIK